MGKKKKDALAFQRNRLEITLVNGQKARRINVVPFRNFIRSLMREFGVKPDQVSVLFTDDATMRKFNLKFRKKDRTTDVLSFPGGEETMEGLVNLGDIVISVPTAFRQAREAGWPLATEIKKLLTHGILHLMGYDHETDHGLMRALEKDCLKKLTTGRSSRRSKP